MLEALGGTYRSQLGESVCRSDTNFYKWEAFKSDIKRVQGRHVPIRLKGRAGKFMASRCPQIMVYPEVHYVSNW